MKKRILSVLLAFAFAVTILPMSFAEATTTVGTTAYSDVIKVKNTAYCSGMSGIYKVKLKNNKPVKKKLLVKTGWGCFATSMIKKGNYIYYFLQGSGAGGNVYRVNIKNGKKQRLTGYLNEGDYTIVNNKLYYSKLVYDSTDEYFDDWDYTGLEKTVCAKLNGTSKKAVKVTIKNRYKRSNAKGYKTLIKEDFDTEYTKDYLKAPKGKLFLGKKKM